MDDPDGPSVIIRVLMSKRGRQKGQCQSDVIQKNLDRPLLALKMEEGSRGQLLEAGKGEKKTSSRASRWECSVAPADTLILAQ